MKIELGKDDQYQTRDGRPVRIHAVDMDGEYSVLVSIHEPGKGWVARYVKPDGSILMRGETENDIIEKSVVKEYWVNGYPFAACGHLRREDAEKNAGCDRTLLLHFQYRECDAVDGVIHLKSWNGK